MSSQHALLLLGSSISSIPPSRYLRSLKLPPQRSAAVGFGGRNRISAWLASQKAAGGFGETTEEVMELEGKVLAQTYARAPVVLVRGKGCKVYDAEGRQYLDMGAAFGVSSLGQGDPDLLKAIQEQVHILMDSSGFCSILEVELAKRLVEGSFADRVFFSNSGMEANKVAIEFARKFQIFSQPDVRLPATEFIAFTNSFHGRTLGSLALMNQENYRSPFEPVMPGVTFMEYGNIEMVKNAIQSGKTAAVFVELVQGEGGIYSATKEFLQALRSACDDAGALLIFDEVQSGMGRSGYLWAHEAYSVFPDIMTLGMPLAGGLPIGAVLTTESVAAAISSAHHAAISSAHHGETFASGPLVCRAALVILDKIQNPEFLASVSKKGQYLKELLLDKLVGNPHLKEVRGLGLLVGVELDVSSSPLVDACRNSGLLIAAAAAGKENVVQLAPALVISEQELELAAAIISESMASLDGNI